MFQPTYEQENSILVEQYVCPKIPPPTKKIKEVDK